jgi:ornithine cyclodeaminase/thiomorpholine-carboxylate dehydrogenase
MAILVLSANEVERLLDPDALFEALAEGFRALSEGKVEAPKRIGVTLPAGSLLVMPAYQQSSAIAVKLVSVFHGNAQLGLPTHQALICVFDPNTGAPLTVMDGSAITALRTAGAAALATRLLAPADSHVLAIVGAGVQGRSHLMMMSRVCPFTEIRIASRHQAHAEDLAATDARAWPARTVEEAVRGADVVCLCTSASEPVISREWLAQGAHVTSVGYAPPGGELDRQVVEQGHLFVETRLAFEPPPAGCAELAGLDPSTGTELGEVLLGSRPGRRSRQELTVYKAMGHAGEDLAAASLVYHRARQEGAGLTVEL